MPSLIITPTYRGGKLRLGVEFIQLTLNVTEQGLEM